MKIARTVPVPFRFFFYLECNFLTVFSSRSYFKAGDDEISDTYYLNVEDSRAETCIQSSNIHLRRKKT